MYSSISWLSGVFVLIAIHVDVQKLLGDLGVRKPFVFNLPTTLHVENLSSKAIHMASSEATRRCSLILSRRQHCITFSVTDVL